jgi:DNA-binding IclR family transcriptional regulator
MEPSYQNIDRTAAILRVLGERNGAGARLTDVALSAKLSKSTAHRLIASLIGAGLVEQDETTRLFHLGFDLFVLGSKAANRYGLVEIADASLTNLVERTADTVYLQARSGAEAVCLERRQGAFPIKTLTLSIGDRRPLGIGAGSLAMLAALTDEDVALALDANAARLLPYRAFDASTIWELVEATRRNGYAWNDGRVVPGMHAIGISVLGTNGAPIGALSVAAIESRMIGERREHIVGWLRTEVTALEARLGRMTERLGDLGMRRLVGAN